MYRPFRRLLLVSAAAGLCALAAAGPALACAGLVTPGGNVKLLRASTLAAWADGIEHYVTSFTFQGGGAEFGSIVPLPGIPSKVERGGDWTLQRLEREVAPPTPQAARAGSADAAAGSGRGGLQHPHRRPRHHHPQGRRRLGRPVGPGPRLPAHARRPRGPRLLRRPVEDLHGRPVQRRRRQGAQPGDRRRHPDPSDDPDGQPLGAAADPRASARPPTTPSTPTSSCSPPTSRTCCRSLTTACSRTAASRPRSRCSTTSAPTRGWSGCPSRCGSPTCASPSRAATSATTSPSTNTVTPLRRG